MIKFNQLGKVKYNLLGRAKYNSRFAIERVQFFTQLAGAMPIIYNQKGERLGILENADEVILDQEVGSIDTLTFEVPFNDPKAIYIENENLVELVDNRYIIRRVTKKRSSSNLSLEVYCEATWYDLQQAEPMKVWTWENATPREILEDMLEGTGWYVGKVEINSRRNLSLEEGLVNRLKAMNELPSIFDGELKFNTKNNTVDFLVPRGRDSGAAIVYRKNMDEIEHEYSTDQLTTKLYLYGKDNMSIADAHPEGKEYIENYEYTDKVRVTIMKDERFTNPYHLYEKGVNALKILSRPTGSYRIKLSDLSILSGLSHEQFYLGDTVWVFDEELQINDRKRIMKWRYNVKRPWDTEVILESKHPTLSELLSGIQEGSGFLQSEDAVERDEMLNLNVFNYLLNSRADDGFSYWTNKGWEIDPVNGYSGNASFKAVGEPGTTKELIQEVFPSHREEYSISFRASTDNIALGENGRIGIYVTVKYVDGTEDEPVFISLVGE
jgi:phage minor structural protein